MLPSADQLFKDPDFIFQQDLAPAHTAKSTKSWLNNHGVGVLDCPANSPDLDPIENLWGIVLCVPVWLSGRALRQMHNRLWVRFPGNTHANEKCIT